MSKLENFIRKVLENDKYDCFKKGIMFSGLSKKMKSKTY